MIHGFTTDEGMYFISQFFKKPSTSNRLYTVFLESLFGNSQRIVKKQYPPQVHTVFRAGFTSRSAHGAVGSLEDETSKTKKPLADFRCIILPN